MTTLGQMIEELAASGKVSDADANITFTLARFHRKHGRLTLPQEATAWLLARDYGLDVSSIERPVDDDSDVVEFEPLPHQVAGVQEILEQPRIKRRSTVKFTVRDNLIVTETPFALKDLCKSIPGRKWSKAYGRTGAWVWPAGPIAATALLEAFKPYDPDYDEEFGDLLTHLNAAAEHKIATDLPDIDTVKTTAWMHQRQAYFFVRALDAAALWMDMGTGKSLVAVARAMDIGGDILIVCPDKVVGVWPREFKRHAATDVHIENGLRRKKRGLGHMKMKVGERMEAFDKLRGCQCGRPHVYVLNYEATIHEPMKTFLKNRSWDLVIYDEAHRLKSPTGAISKQAHAISQRSNKRLELTGTPMPHSPLDVFGQFRALDTGIFGTSFTSMKHRYAVMGGYEGKEIIGMNPATLDELHQRCFQVAFRVQADDVLDLPPVLDDQYLTCTMEGPQAKAYLDMAGELTAEFPGVSIADMVQAVMKGETIAANAMVKLLRLRQITGGALKDDETETVLQIGESKEKLLLDWMEDYPPTEPLVIFVEFTYDIDVIRRVGEKLGRRTGEVSGRRNDLTQDSEYPPDRDLLAVQIASGGAGVDLTRACYAAYYSVGYNNGNYRQSRKRLHRPGQTRPVRFTHLLAEDTVDIEVYETLEGREDTSSSVLDR